MTESEVPDRYVVLCLRVGELLEDFVDAYIGPVALKERALAGVPHDPRDLREEAQALLQELPGAGLEPDRTGWLEGQLRAIDCVTERLSGADITWSDEVERCFGIRPQHIDEEVFREVHARLEDALPGSGDLSARYNGWTEATEVPRDRLEPATEIIATELRRRTRELVALPDDETVVFEPVTDEPWMAFNWYKGELHSLVEMNLDLPYGISDLVDLVAHEAYPGHHSERACKEQLLLKERGRLEMSVMILSAPEAVISEGIATNALEVVVGEEGYAPVLERLRPLGFDVDAEVADVMHFEGWRLFGAATNVARMIHEDGMSTDDAQEYLQRWALHTPERAAKTITFLTDPGSWTYSTAYTDGKRLVRSFIDRRPDGFRRLLTEQLTVSSLVS